MGSLLVLGTDIGTSNGGSVLECASPLSQFRVRRDRKRQGLAQSKSVKLGAHCKKYGRPYSRDVEHPAFENFREAPLLADITGPRPAESSLGGEPGLRRQWRGSVPERRSTADL